MAKPILHNTKIVLPIWSTNQIKIGSQTWDLGEFSSATQYVDLRGFVRDPSDYSEFTQQVNNLVLKISLSKWNPAGVEVSLVAQSNGQMGSYDLKRLLDTLQRLERKLPETLQVPIEQLPFLLSAVCTALGIDEGLSYPQNTSCPLSVPLAALNERCQWIYAQLRETQK